MNDISLPPYIMTSDPDSFAQKTIQARKPQIINQILTLYDFTPDIRQSLRDFKDELASGVIIPLQETASDRHVWQREIQPWLGKTWLEIPWLLAEAYFYRRVLEITQYFQPGPFMAVDPFGIQKTQEIIDGKSVFEGIYPTMKKDGTVESFREFCIKALWGNRGDLSHVDTLDPSMSTQSHRIILDHLDEAYQFLSHKQAAKMAYFLDNVGKELYFDLALIDWLLGTGVAGKITCYVKNQPYFVSDAMPKDISKTIDLISSNEVYEIRHLGQRLQLGIDSEKIRVEAPPFLALGRMFRQMPPIFQEQIESHDLVILKGDLNYRCIMGDRHWAPTTPIDVAGGYFPSSFLSLRTLKSELVVGLTEDILERVKQEADPDWLTNGNRGVITFYKK